MKDLLLQGINDIKSNLDKVEDLYSGIYTKSIENECSISRTSYGNRCYVSMCKGKRKQVVDEDTLVCFSDIKYCVVNDDDDGRINGIYVFINYSKDFSKEEVQEILQDIFDSLSFSDKDFEKSLYEKYELEYED